MALETAVGVHPTECGIFLCDLHILWPAAGPLFSYVLAPAASTGYHVASNG